MDPMRDPSTANCRIYLGNLEVNTSKSDLQNIFSKYGNIKGVLISRNFGFVQYDNEQSVNNAIENENQKTFKGRKLTVSKVQKKFNPKDNKSNATNQNEPSNNQNVANEQTPANNSNNNDMNKNASATIGNNPPMNMNKNKSNNSNNSNMSSSNTGGGNNNPNNNNAGNSHQNMGNNSSRQQWRNNRNNNNNNRNMNNNSNEMNLHTDRERSPLDGGRNSNNDRRNQDGGGGGGGGNNSNNNFRHNNRTGNNKNNNANHNNNNNNNSNNNSHNNMSNNNYNQSRNDNNSKFGILQNAGDVPKNVLTGGVLRGFPSAREIRARHPDANDCEIVVMDKLLTDYAEFIENRVRRLGLSADLLFPTTMLTNGKMLSNIANRGSLFAILLSQENKEMRSVTVNILYGIPAEHRNMPLEDAIQLIHRNYEDLRQGAQGDIIGDNDESPYASVALAAVRHPDSIQHLINLLADNRCLTVLQFDCILKYLQERRELQYKFELGDTNTDVQMQDVKPIKSEIKQEEHLKTEALDSPKQEPNDEEELQKRLLEILNKPSIPNMKVESPISKGVSDSRSPSSSACDIQEPQLLNDPSVKNALDSLFSF